MRSVLIVEDDLPTQQLLAALMRRDGFTPVIAGNGAEAFRAVASIDLALIILDLMMPQVDGQAVIEFLEKKKARVPVIVCTAAGPRLTDEITSSVVKAIVRKPFDIEHLTTLVSSLTS